MARNRILPADANLRRIQDGVERSIDDEVLSIPIVNGALVEDKALVSGTNVVFHRLGRIPRGYIVVKSNAAIDVHSTGQTAENIDLVSSAAATVSIWFF